jgi:hypothetical protein
MLVKDYDAIKVLIVDKRWDDEYDRLDTMIRNRGGAPDWFLEGKGKLLAKGLYDQISPTPPVGWRFTPAGYYHFRAIQGIVRQAKEEGAGNVLIVEDDCVFTDEFDQVVGAATVEMKEMSADWDILYYGANHSPADTFQMSPHVLRVFGSLTTHCFGVRNTAYDAILDLRPTDMIDALIARELHPWLYTLAIWPNVALQKPGFSTIWNQYVDYTTVFDVKGGRAL